MTKLPSKKPYPLISLFHVFHHTHSLSLSASSGGTHGGDQRQRGLVEEGNGGGKA